VTLPAQCAVQVQTGGQLTCRLSDLVGADIGFHVGKNFLDEKPQQFYPAAIFKLMVDHNMLGEKTPAGGFYSFEKNKCAVHAHAPHVLRAAGPLAAASMWLCSSQGLTVAGCSMFPLAGISTLSGIAHPCPWLDMMLAVAAGVRGRPTPRSSRSSRRRGSRRRCRPPTSWASAPRYRLLTVLGAARDWCGRKPLHT
jgi:hypothetical protein